MRTQNVERRILETAGLPEFVELEYSVRPIEFGIEILANGHMLSVTTVADA